MNSYFWILTFTICLLIGVGFGCALGAIVHTIRKKKDENATFVKCTSSLILPSIMFCMAIGFIIAISKLYGFPVELLVLSALIVAGFFSATETKNAWPFFILLGAVIVYLPSKHYSIKAWEAFITWLHKRKRYTPVSSENNNL